MFEKKAQGSLEYLLLIGGAVLVAAIVIALVVSTSSGTGNRAQKEAFCLSLNSYSACTSTTPVTTPSGTQYTPSTACTPYKADRTSVAMNNAEFAVCMAK